MEAYLAHVSESTIEARGCRPIQSRQTISQTPFLCRQFVRHPTARRCSDTIELDYEMLCLADPGRGSKGAANAACPMAWAESCAVTKECKDRKWGPHSQRGQKAGPQIWIDGRRPCARPSVVLPSSARTRKRENHSGGERGLSLSRPPRAIAEGGRGRRRCHAMLLLWNGHGVDINE